MQEPKKIIAAFIFEILGRPPKHIENSLEKLIEDLGKINGIDILKKKIHKAKLIKKENIKNLFTSFAEVELQADDLNKIFSIVFNMFPAHIEILEPKELILKNFDLSATLSALTVKLHRYDEMTKTLIMQGNILAEKLKECSEKKEKRIITENKLKKLKKIKKNPMKKIPNNNKNKKKVKISKKIKK